MKKSLLSFIAMVVVIAILTATAGFGLNLGFVQIPSVEEGIRLGIDLVGGSVITFQAEVPEGMSESEINDGMNTAQSMLRERIDSFGYTEALLSRMGNTRIRVEIPEMTDTEQAISQLGSTARLEFRDADGNVIMYGDQIEEATVKKGLVNQSDTVEQYYVSLTMNEEAQAAFTAATKTAANATDGKNYIGIYLDDEQKSQPYVDSEFADTGITGDTVIITLGGTAGSSVQAADARELAQYINIGQLPFTLTDVESYSVGPQLGEKSLETSLLAGLIGLILIIIFMIAIYRLSGAVAGVALIFYTALVTVVLSFLQVNLSLPGIAGIILSIGMAVDANVVIFERVKEELRSGKTLRSSIDAGFHRAFTAILDSNITTLIAAGVLWWKGTGSIQGFAITLFIGVILSMFTALVVTRWLLKNLVEMRITNIKAYGA